MLPLTSPRGFTLASTSTERPAEAAVGDAENVGENEPNGAACGTWNPGVRVLGT